MTLDGKTLAIIALAVFLIYIFFIKPKTVKSSFVLEGAPYQSDDAPPAVSEGASPDSLPAGMLPKEVPVSEDFSQFSTDTILANQNYLDPRNMIGYPETIGGTLRNANWQIRSEPPNPRDPVSIFNLSTIVPEQMRPLFEIQDSDYK
jgi:hypothetical protein